MNLLILISFMSMLMVGLINNKQTKEVYDARIETEVVDGKLVINNVFQNKSQQEVNFFYKFKCKRQSRSGSSATSQSGSFKATPGETVTLSKTAVSFTSGDDYTLSLEVFNSKGTVVSDTFTSDSE